MKRTISVSLGGRTFVLETDAYADLKNYLDQIGRNIRDLNDRQEVLMDIEQRIGEYFWEWRGARGMVIRLEDVQRVKSIIGNGDEPYAESADYNEPRRRQYRKLYRDGQDKVIGGVCSGIAYFFNVSPVLMRILFGICLIFAFSSFWIYLVLWIALPMARTRRERLEMKGLPITAENLAREGM